MSKDDYILLITFLKIHSPIVSLTFSLFPGIENDLSLPQHTDYIIYHFPMMFLDSTRSMNRTKGLNLLYGIFIHLTIFLNIYFKKNIIDGTAVPA